MQVILSGAIVKEIKDWDTDQKGVSLPPQKVQSQITFFDRVTGGDVVITFGPGHGFVVGHDANVEVIVKPQIRNYKLSLYAQLVSPSVNNPKK